MRIGIVSRADIADVRSNSGYPYFMARALEKHVGEIVLLSPDKTFVTKLIEKSGRGLDRLSFKLVRRHLSGDQNRLLSRRLSKVFSARIERAQPDVIFAPNASVEIAQLSTSKPIIYSTDQNWVNMVNYYPNTSSVFPFADREADRIEAAAQKKASAVLFPSLWASEAAIAHYGVPAAKIHTIPWGANFDPCDIPSREVACAHPIESEIQLLWVGVDWQRKGGAIAYDCLLNLLAKNVSAQLTVCGCVPPKEFVHPRVTVVPFLDKRNPLHRTKLSSLFLRSHFFVFPTLAEAYGIVLCEASAHGLPSLVRNTGGVGGAIVSGVNGFLVEPEASGKEYAAKIIETVESPGRYQAIVNSTRDAYEKRLNWDSWGRSVRDIFDFVIGKHSNTH